MTSEQPTLTIFNESLTSHFLPPPLDLDSPSLNKQGIGELLPQQTVKSQMQHCSTAENCLPRLHPLCKSLRPIIHPAISASLLIEGPR